MKGDHTSSNPGGRFKDADVETGLFFFFFFLGSISLFSCLRRHIDVLYRVYTTNVATSLRLRSRADKVNKIYIKIKIKANIKTPYDLHFMFPSASMCVI
jgi:hypothetical protein